MFDQNEEIEILGENELALKTQPTSAELI